MPCERGNLGWLYFFIFFRIIVIDAHMQKKKGVPIWMDGDGGVLEIGMVSFCLSTQTGWKG